MSPKRINEITIKVEDPELFVEFCMVVSAMSREYGMRGYLSQKKREALQIINNQIFDALWPEQERLD